MFDFNNKRKHSIWLYLPLILGTLLYISLVFLFMFFRQGPTNSDMVEQILTYFATWIIVMLPFFVISAVVRDSERKGAEKHTIKVKALYMLVAVIVYCVYVYTGFVKELAYGEPMNSTSSIGLGFLHMLNIPVLLLGLLLAKMHLGEIRLS